MRTNNFFARKMVGALMGALVVSVVLSLVGYSDEGPTKWDYLKELTLALPSYLLAALLVHWTIKRDNILLEIIGVSLMGSAIAFLLKIVFLEGQNGIPSYIARYANERSLRPFGDLVLHALSFTALTALIALPIVAIGMCLGGWWARNHLNTSGP